MGFSLGGVAKGIGAQFGLGGGGAAGDASKAMARASSAAGNLYDAYGTQLDSAYAPYTGAGTQAMGMLQSGTADYNSPLMKTFGSTDFTGDPGYQWRLQQGVNALQSSAASKGNLFSGATGKAMTDYGQNFASNEYNNAYNRYSQDQNNQFSRLYQLGSMGLNAQGGLQGGKQFATSGKGNALMGIGEAKASGYLGQAQQKSDGFSNLISAGSMAAAFSDVNLKDNVTQVGVLPNGINVYSWSWNKIAESLGLVGESVGVLAQEIMAIIPDAVIQDDSGFLKVNYANVVSHV